MNLKENISRVKQIMGLLKEEDDNKVDNYPVPLPENYKGRNGNLSESELKAPVNPLGKEYVKMYDGYNYCKLSLKACEAFEKMEKKFYEETGEVIGEGNFSWGYRTYKTQFEWTDWDCLNRYGVYKRIPMGGPKCTVDIAVPGTSNHGWGTAIDIGGRVQSWLMQKTIDSNTRNGEVFGWWWGEAPSEPWHFTFSDSLYEKNKSLRGESDLADFDLANFDLEDVEDIETQKLKTDIDLRPLKKYTDFILSQNKFDDPNYQGGFHVEPFKDD